MKKINIDSITNLIKTIVWPLIFLLIFLSYKSEFNRVIELIPLKFAESTRVSLGTFTLEIQETAKSTGNDELGDVITNLSEAAVRKLLSLGTERRSIIIRGSEDGEYILPDDYEVYLELQNKGLLDSDEPLLEFFNFFLSLSPEANIRYRNSRGQLSSLMDHPTDSQIIQYKLNVNDITFSKEREEKIEGLTVKASEKGQEALEILLEVITSQLSDN
jgi:hypothetical protein